MNWRDVVSVDANYIGPNDLQFGDLFMEDTYPEVYRVVAFDTVEGHRAVIAIDTDTNAQSTWFGSGAYAPCLVRVKQK